jgi:hypothetical protein
VWCGEAAVKLVRILFLWWHSARVTMLAIQRQGSALRVSFSIFLGVPFNWKSKGQKGVTLLSSEAEFVALSESSKEFKFVFQVLRRMGLKVNLPIIVHVDNVGAIFIGTNVTVSQQLKHIDI